MDFTGSGCVFLSSPCPQAVKVLTVSFFFRSLSTFNHGFKLVYDPHSSRDLSVVYRAGSHSLSFHVRILLFAVCMKQC